MSKSQIRFCTTKQLIKQTKFHRVTHCIFDMDGTILDSEIIYHQAIAKVCRSNSCQYTEDLKEKLQGATLEQMCKTLCEELKLSTTPKQLEEIMEDKLAKTPLKEGAERLIYHLAQYRIPIALATNSTLAAVMVHFKANPKLFSLFHHLVTISDKDVLRGKPQPDLYLVAAARFDERPKPSMCLVFEDSPAGVLAAKAAGMQVVMTPDKNLNRCHTKLASLVLSSLLHFKPKLFGLPTFPLVPCWEQERNGDLEICLNDYCHSRIDRRKKN